MNRWRTGIIVATALLTGLSACDDGAARLNRATEALAAGRYGNAEIEIRNALQDDPDDPGVLEALFDLGVRSGDLTTAGNALERLGSIESGGEKLGELRARYYLAKGDFTALVDQILDGQLKMGEPRRSLMLVHGFAGTGRAREARDVAIRLVAEFQGDPACQVALAESLFALGDVAGAESMLRSTVRTHDTSASAWMSLGSLLSLRGKSRDAEAAWQRALQHAGSELTLVERMGMLSGMTDLHLRRGDIAGARRLRDELLALAPQSAIAVAASARVDLAEGHPDVAARRLRPLVASQPPSAELRLLLLAAQLAEGSVQQAREQVAGLVSTTAESDLLRQVHDATIDAAKARSGVERWRSISGALALLGHPMAARQASGNALEAAPGDLAASLAMVQLELATGSATAGLARVEKLRTAHPENVDVGLAYAAASATTGAVAEADRVYAELVDRTGDSRAAIALHGLRILKHSGDELAPLLQARRRNARNIGLRVLLADAFRKGGRLTEAVSEMQGAAALDSQNAALLNNLALLYRDVADPRALATSSKAYALQPGNAAVADTYAWMLVEGEEADRAMPILKAAYASAPGNRTIGYHLAEAYSRTGSNAAAEQVLREVLAVEGLEFAEKRAALALLERLGRMGPGGSRPPARTAGS